MRDVAVAACFDNCFLGTHNTRMIGGAQEPLYLPADAGNPACLYYREDFAASALHEAAHWCIAGVQRREQTDFGYLYEPPPRSSDAQQRFFCAEVRTQTLESLFAAAAGLPFRPSADNLDADVDQFVAALGASLVEVQSWVAGSADDRARRFISALTEDARG